MTLGKNSFIGIYYDAAQKYGDRAALFEGEDSRTFKQIYENGRRVATFFKSLGIKKNEVVAIVYQNTVQYLETELGIIMNGAIPLKINWRFTAPELTELFERNDVRFVCYNLVGDAYLNAVKAATENTAYKAINFVELAKEYSKYEPMPEDEIVDRGDDEVIMHLHTSGTTGHPKVVRYRQGEFLEEIRDIADTCMFKEDTIFQNMSQLFHVASVGTYGCMMRGSTVIYFRNFNVDTYLKSIAKHKVNRMSAIPTVLSAIADLPNIKDYDLSTVKIISYSTCPMPVALIQRIMEIFPGVGFMQVYGMTEMGSGITAMMPEDHLKNNMKYLTSVGKQIKNHEVKIMREDGSFADTNENGEIVVRGEGRMLDYYGMPDKTEEVFRNGWYHTGDMGYYDEDGYLYISGRADDMIISGGENIFPKEIENVINKMEGIDACAVVGVKDSYWIQVVHACVIMQEGYSYTEKEIRDYCRGKIAGYKIPKVVHFMKDFPRTSTGKIKSKELVEIISK